jgi:hypothetical protein
MENSNFQVLIGKTLRYKGVEHLVQSYSYRNQTHYLVTDKEWFEFPSEEHIKDFLAICVEVEVGSMEIIHTPKAATDENGLSKPNSSSGNVMAYLKGILVEDIERVREDPEYVEQAKTVSNNIKRLVDIAKLELQIKSQNKK